MKKQRKGMQGITLIALVVTIVVLLILAGVSIAMLTGENGIITQAQTAKENTRGGEVKEAVEMAANENKMYDYAPGNKKSKGDVISDLVGKGKLTAKEAEELNGTDIITIGDIEIDFSILGKSNGTGGGNPPTVQAGVPGQTYETETKVSIGTDEVVIPGGATISGITGENDETTVAGGLVIYIIDDADGDNQVDSPNWDDPEYMQETYDQFVWVPVPNAIAVDKDADSDIDTTDIDLMIEEEQYPMAIATGTTTDDDGNTVTNYRGVLYDFTEATNTEGKVKVCVADKSYSATSGNREPAYLTGSSYADASDYNTVGITESSLQTEFNTMVTEVAKDGGFWVGRYETSDMSSSSAKDLTQQISVIKGTTTGINSLNWYRMYAQQKNYSNLAEITSTSSMLWGSQWNQIMIWMKDVDNESQGSKYVVNALGMGNFGLNADGTTKTTKAVEVTGNSENYKVKNVYDLSGNVNDRTLEAYGDDVRVLRRGRLQQYQFHSR